MSNELEIFDKSTLKKTEQRVREMQDNGEVDFPPNYSPGNALKSMWLKLQSAEDKNGNPVLETCTKTSVMETMLDVVMQGLNPAKDQVYPVAWGKELTAQKSYFGRMALVKRVEDIKEIRPNLIYEGDEIVLENKDGRQIISKHETSWENRKKEIDGAYVVIVFGDDRPDNYTIMTREEIEQAWAQGPGKNKSQAHKNFSGEMAKKTVINRACKPIYKSSDDADLLVGKPEFSKEQALEKQVEDEKDEKANSEVIDVETDDDQEMKETETEEQSESDEEPDDEENDLVPPGDRENRPF